MERVAVVKTARITVETDTIVVIRHAKASPAWCPGCQARVEVITLEQSGLAEPTAAAQVQEWLKTGKLHLWQLAEGPAQICLPSLLRCLEGEGTARMRIPKEGT